MATLKLRPQWKTAEEPDFPVWALVADIRELIPCTDKFGGFTRMEKHDDYISGPHHYWFQFAGGFIFGAGSGAYVISRFFESGVIVLLVSVATALLFGFHCGRWGERAWRSISDWFHTWWRGL